MIRLLVDGNKQLLNLFGFRLCRQMYDKVLARLIEG